MDAPWPFDGLEERLQIPPRGRLPVPGHAAEDELEPRLVHVHEGVGVEALETGELDVHTPGHELHHKGADRVLEEDGAVVLILDIEPEAHGDLELAANGRPVREVQLEESGVDLGVFRTHIEGSGIIEPGERFLELGLEGFHGEGQGPALHVQDHAGEVLRGLDVHVLR